MKKLLLIIVGCVLFWVTIHVMLKMGGGSAMLYRKIEYNWYVFESMRKHDPGQCAKISDDMAQGKPGYLRENCFYAYMDTHMESRSDCVAPRLIVDGSSIMNMNTLDWFRQECLIAYYKRIFVSPVAQKIKACDRLSDRLIEFTYYRQNLRSNHENTPIIKNPFITDLDIFENCEHQIKEFK